MTVLDYYGSTIALSVIVLWSETNTTVGIGWVLLMNILGSPFACALHCLSITYASNSHVRECDEWR